MKKSEFQFEGYRINKSLFELNKEANSFVDLSINFNPSGVLDKTNSRFELLLSTLIVDKSKCLKIEIDVIGYFSFSFSFSEEDDINNFLLLNAPAILFPYVRSYISTLSTLSGINSIVLPTLNLSNLKDLLSQNIEIIS